MYFISATFNILIIVISGLAHFCQGVSTSPSKVPSRSPTVAPSRFPTVPPVSSPTQYLLITYAGTSLSGYSGDGGPTAMAQFSSPNDVYEDSSGVSYIADQSNSRIRSISRLQLVSTFAGGGTSTANNVPATTALIYTPSSVWGDSTGRIFITDFYTCVVRVIVNGVITDYAGASSYCSTQPTNPNGDGGQATSATLNLPSKVCGDLSSIYIADRSNVRYRKVDSLGIITTVIGTGNAANTGDGGPPTSAAISNVDGIFVDTIGNIFVSDSGQNVIRMASGGVMSTFAGVAGVAAYNGDGLKATNTYLNSPKGLWASTDGILFTIDLNNARIRQTGKEAVYTVAGNELSGMTTSTNVMATAGSIGTPNNLFVTTQGNLYFADTEGNIIRKMSNLSPTTSPTVTPTLGPTISPSLLPSLVPTVLPSILPTTRPSVIPTGSPSITRSPTCNPAGVPSSPPAVAPTQYLLTTFAGQLNMNGFSGDGGLALGATFASPFDIFQDSTGVSYIVDQGNGRVRAVGVTNIINTIVGDGGTVDTSSNIPATSASLRSPFSVWADTVGKLFVSDDISCVIRVINNGVITFYAGVAASCNTGGDSGSATNAKLRYPYYIHGDGSALYISDKGNFRVRKVNAANGIITTVVGSGNQGYGGDNGPATSARLISVNAVFVDSIANLYLSDNISNVVRFVRNGIITTIAGVGSAGYNGDGQMATATMFSSLWGVRGDTVGNLFVVDTYNYRVRMISSSSLVYTVAGTGSAGPTPFASIPSTATTVGYPQQTFVDTLGNIYFADTTGPNVKKMSNLNPTQSPTVIPTILPSGAPSYYIVPGPYTYTIAAFAGTGQFGSTGDGASATVAQLQSPWGMWVDSIGATYIADFTAGNIRKVDRVGNIDRFAGYDQENFCQSGLATEIDLGGPIGVAGDTNGNLYISESGSGIVRIVLPSGDSDVFAGSCNAISLAPSDPNGDNGHASSATFNMPALMVADISSHLYVVDYGNKKIRRINLNDNIITTVVGTGDPAMSQVDGTPATSTSVTSIQGLAVDASGNIYFSDTANLQVRKMFSISQIVKRVAGTGDATFNGYGLPGTSTALTPIGLWVDSKGNLFIGDSGILNKLVRMLSITDGKVYVIAGTVGYTTLVDTGNGGAATAATFQDSSYVYGSSDGSVLVGEISSAVRKLWYVTPTQSPSLAPTSPTFQPTRQPTSQPSMQPSSQPTSVPSTPTGKPTRQPTSQPSMKPSRQPTTQPSSHPTTQPVSRPTSQPTQQPSRKPSRQPSSQPSRQPTGRPSVQPSRQPTRQPSTQPSSQPLSHPSFRPTNQPTGRPTRQPTRRPTTQPSQQPLSCPSSQPSNQPSAQPSRQPSSQPTSQPSCRPSCQPCGQPSRQPSAVPTRQPSSQPSRQPSSQPSAQPSSQPSRQPSGQPSSQPVSRPSAQPSCQPTRQPTAQPSTHPSYRPTYQPTSRPSARPSTQPSLQPIGRPSCQPSSQPSVVPSSHPSANPSSLPSGAPTTLPSSQPAASPSSQPSVKPTGLPSSQPTARPTADPTSAPSGQPSVRPTGEPSGAPSSQPSSQPTSDPSAQPTCMPSVQPFAAPTAVPTCQPATEPTGRPTVLPTGQPTCLPSSNPTKTPSVQPSSRPSVTPTRQPTSKPSAIPSNHPTTRPSTVPTMQPTTVPSSRPSNQPSDTPSAHPSVFPSSRPSSHPTSQPSTRPTSQPSCQPSSNPSNRPSVRPTSYPKSHPTSLPSSHPTTEPTRQPTPRSQFPYITSRVLSVNRTSVSVESRLSFPGVVYCSALLSGVVPSSVEQLKMTAVLSTSDRNNATRISIHGLNSLTSYKVYCFSESNWGEVAPISNIVSAGLSITTQCCKSLSLRVSSTVITGRNVLDFVSISVDTLPSVELRASLTLSSGSGVSAAPVNVTLVPSQITLTPASSLNWKIALPSLPVGNFTCRVVLSGPSVSEYDVVSQSLFFQVIGTEQPLPAPVLQSATFSSDGIYVIATFDSNTDWGNTSSVFQCSALFGFTCAETSQCQWVSPSTVHVFVSPWESCATVGDSFTLLPVSRVLAQCLPSSGCSTPSQAAATVSLTIAGPTIVAAPVIVISAPNAIGGCDSLTIDLTASSGHGGRSWSSVSLAVQTGINSDVIQGHLDLKGVVSPPLYTIPAVLMGKNTTYGFVVTMCNFLGGCSSIPYKVRIHAAAVPVVTLPGISLRYVSREDLLTIPSRAVLTSGDNCNITSAALRYHWQVISSESEVMTQNPLTSTSKDPSKLRLPAYSLTVGQLYTMTLSVSTISDVLAASSSASVQVYVQQGNLVAVLSSGSTLLVVSGSSAVIDGAQSYDEDVFGLVGVGAGLRFSWSCSQTSPQLSESCGSILSLLSVKNDTRLEVTAEIVAITSTALVTVTVSDPSASRTSTATVEVSVLPSNAPLTSITSNLGRNQLNRRQVLTLTGQVSLPPRSACNVTWSVNDTSAVDLFQVAQSPVITSLRSTDRTLVSLVYLVLAGNTLPSLNWFGGFSLTCQLTPTLRAVSTIAVEVNSCPTPGTFTVAPLGSNSPGIFTFSADKWSDSDLPLSYQFGVVSVSSTTIVLLSRSEFTHGTALIPVDRSVGSSVQCVAVIFDSLSNNASSFASIASGVAPTVDSVLFDSSLQQSADQTRQTAAYVSAVLNAVDCSLAPNCTSLHRTDCSVTMNTCGNCVAGFAGESGNSNTQCVVPSKLLVSGAFKLCSIDGVCVIPQKQCLNNCSGHGNCTFVNADSGAAVTECIVGDTSCQAMCRCDLNYFGSVCGLTLEKLNQKQAYREQVIGLVANLMNSEDADEQSVESWINSLSEISGGSGGQASDEISVVAAQALLNATATHLTLATEVGLSVASTESMLSTIQTAMMSGGSSEQTQALLQDYFSFAAVGMVPTQTALSVMQSQFRGEVRADTPGNVTMSEPLSVLELRSAVSAASVGFPFTSAVNVTAATALKSSLIVYRSGWFPNATQLRSNPVSVHLSQLPCDADSKDDCNLDLVLPFTQPLTEFDVNPNIPEFANITCVTGVNSFLNYTCRDDQTLQLECNGTFGGVLQQQCRLVTYTPVCRVMGLEGDVTCSVVSYSNTSILCSCPIVNHLNELKQRRLSGNGSSVHDDGSYSVSYVAMLDSVETSFLSTVNSADHLNESTLRKGWRAVLTVGVFAMAVLCALYLSQWSDAYQADKKSNKVKSDEDKTNLVADLLKKTSSGKQRSRRNHPRRRKVSPSAGNGDYKVHQDLQLIENSLPSILSSRSMSQKVMAEIKQHHRWFGIIFFYCENFPRVLRVISLSTNIVIMLFIQSLTYTLTNANNGTCETFTNQADCLAPRSPYATGESKCLWTPAADTASVDTANAAAVPGVCSYVTPNGNAKIILFVAVFSALISTPLALLVDWMIHSILAAATDNKLSLFARPKRTTLSVVSSRVEMVPQHNESLVGSSIYFGFGSANRRVTSTAIKENRIVQLASAQSTLRTMQSELLACRKELEPRQRIEFDLLWGLNHDGDFHSEEHVGATEWFLKYFRKTRPDVRSLLLNELCDVSASVEKEKFRFSEYLVEDRNKGKRLLYLFQKDLLPGIQGQVLEAKVKRDNFQVKKTSKGMKLLSWGFIGALNAGMLFYILLFALNETEQQQSAWFQSFVLWLCLEVFLASTVIVLVTHVLIPLWTMKDVHKIKETLLTSLREFKASSAAGQKGNQQKLEEDGAMTHRFNAAQYLFVSTQMAREYPKLKESQIISHFSTPWPKRSYQHVIDVSKQYSKKFSAIFRSLSVVVLYFLTTSLSVPPHLQDMVIHTVTTASVGYTILLHIDLFHIFPLLALAPFLVCCVVAHFLIQSSKAGAQRRLNLTVSPSNENLRTLSAKPDTRAGSGGNVMFKHDNSPRINGGAGRKSIRKTRVAVEPTEKATSGVEEVGPPQHSPLNRNPKTRSPSLRHSAVSPRLMTNKHIDRRKSLQQGLATVAALRHVHHHHSSGSSGSSSGSDVISAMTPSVDDSGSVLGSPGHRQHRHSTSTAVNAKKSGDITNQEEKQWSDDDSFHRFEVACDEEDSSVGEDGTSDSDLDDVVEDDDDDVIDLEDDEEEENVSEYDVSLMDSNDFAQLYYENNSYSAGDSGLVVSAMAADNRSGYVRTRSSMDADSVDDLMRVILDRDNSIIEEKEQL